MKITRMSFCFLIAIMISAPTLAQDKASSQSNQAAPKPNIVYIISDDQGWKDVGYHGSDIKTPNIDKLAQTGAKLEQFYSQPMCTPTRAAMLTGRYPLRYGLQTMVIPASMTYGLPTDEWLLPQALKEAGYTTSIFGKWHLGHGKKEFWPKQRGFDYQYGALVGEIDYYTHQAGGKTDWFRNNELLEEKGYLTTLIGEDAVRYIDKQDPKKPFFMYVAFTAPHAPFQAPQEYIDQYKQIPDINRRTYAAMVTAMDDQIGKIVDELDKKGLRKNTIVIFHSDNGGNQNAHLGEAKVEGSLPASNGPYRGGKGDLYEGGSRVISLINWPGKIKEGTVVNGMMHVVDYYPTLAHLAGASTAKSKGLDGKDMWPTITQSQPSPRSEIVYNIELFRGAVREGDWKLVWKTLLPTQAELFNLAQDPYEKNNLAAQAPTKVAELQARINQLGKEMAKSMLLEEIFKSVTTSAVGKPPALPNEDEFYEQAD